MTPPARRVIRLCSVYEPPPESLAGRGIRFDPIGGMQNHTAALTRALDVLGVAQDVVTTRPPGAPARQRVGSHATIHRLGLPVRSFRQLYSLPAAALVDRLAPGASLLHAHLGEDLAIVPIALAAARRHQLPWVLTIHASSAHTLVGGGPRGALLRHAGGRLERAGATRADAVIALTPRLARLMSANGHDTERIHVIPSGVVPGEGRLPLPAGAERDGRPRVLYVGRLAEQKGVRYLIEAVARMETRDVDVRIVGDGPERVMLQGLVDRLGVGDRVSFAGFQPHDAVPALMGTADVLVLPSVYEELGSVLVEAMHAGLPIVASDTGGISDGVGDAAVLVPPRDPGALAAALDALLADPARREQLSALARQRSTGFHWDQLAERILGVYEVALSGSPASAATARLTVSPPRAAATPARRHGSRR